MSTIFDITLGVETLGDEQIAIEIFEKFQTTLQKDIDLLNSHCIAGNTDGLKKMIHRIRGASYYASTKKLNEQLNALDSYLNNQHEQLKKSGSSQHKKQHWSCLSMNEQIEKMLNQLSISIETWSDLDLAFKEVLEYKIETEHN